jgi:[ribosomal protein S18]-alanine N-acetyltransferase
MGLEITPVKKRDLKRIMEIERMLFPEPWTIAIFQSELALRRGRLYQAARIDGKIVGYLGMMYAVDEGHVTTLAVDAIYQREGVGTALLICGMDYAIAEGAEQVSLEVAAGNERAQRLYRRFGFAPVGVRKNYYQSIGEDAYVMIVRDVNTEKYAARLDRLREKVSVQ